MKEMIISGKTYEVKEVKYKTFVSNVAGGAKEDSAKILMQASTGISDEDFDNLSMKNGILLQKAVNEINGLSEGFL